MNMVKIVFKCNVCKGPFRGGCELRWDFLEDIAPVCMPAPDTCPYNMTKQNWARTK